MGCEGSWPASIPPALSESGGLIPTTVLGTRGSKGIFLKEVTSSCWTNPVPENSEKLKGGRGDGAPRARVRSTSKPKGTLVILSIIVTK